MIERFGALTLKELWPVHPRLRFGVSVSYAIFFCGLVCSSVPSPPPGGAGTWALVGGGTWAGGGWKGGAWAGGGYWDLGCGGAGVLSWYGDGERALS